MARVALKKLVVVAFVCAAAALFPAQAHAGQCGLPTEKTMWIDHADGNSPFWQLFARPGFIVAAANFIYPPQIRARGAKTIFFDLNFVRRLGTPNAPVDPDTVEERAHRLFDFAAESSACPTPLITLNELQGASTATPWSKTNAQYKANVLTFVKTLASRGARPFLLISSTPYTGGEAADWWREVAQHADLVREVYFPAGYIHKRGAVLGSRTLRSAMRRALTDFFSIGIPPKRLGIMLGFQSGKGGRQGLQPAEAWFEVVKWQTLAAKQVAQELQPATVWSWGWASWGTTERDLDKQAAACIYLWTRDPKLCNVRRYGSEKLDLSLEEAQIRLPAGTRCEFGEKAIRRTAISSLARVTGDSEVAFSALYQRIVETREVTLTPREVLDAERAIVARRFGGSRARYQAALARAGATVAVARGVIADELRKEAIKARLATRAPRTSQIEEYYTTYASTLVREVEASPAPWWLGGRSSGFALSSIAPPEIFRRPTGRLFRLPMVTGPLEVRALTEAVPLAALPLARVRASIVQALRAAARENAYHAWTSTRQNVMLAQARCFRDQLPMPGAIELTTYLPFLAVGDAPQVSFAR